MKKHLTVRQILLVTFSAIFVFYVFTHIKHLQAILIALSQGSWRWLLVAIITQIIYYYAFTKMTQRAFLVIDIKRDFRELYPLVLGALFVNVLAPTGGNSGTILFADDAARREESSTRAVVGYLISVVASYASFFTLLVFAVIFLQHNHLLNNYEVAGALIFIFPTVIPPLLLVFAKQRPQTITRLFGWIKQAFNKISSFMHFKNRIKETWPKVVSEELESAAKIINEHRSQLGQTILLALGAHFVNILSLFLVFVAFDVQIHYGALIAGYVFAEIVRVISPHPEGIGAVEATIVLIFTSFGVDLISATAIAIVFRAINFWAPLGLGFFYLQKLKSFSKVGKS